VLSGALSAAQLKFLATPRRRPARIALQTRAIAHQREVQALRAHLAVIALRLGLGAAFGGDGLGVGLRPLHLLERLGRREFLLGLGFEGGRAGDFAARARGGEGSDFAAGPTPVRLAQPTTPSRGG
jgi:hypothetical protein